MHLRQLVTFSILFLFSIFRPAGVVDGLNLPVGPIAIMAAAILFLTKVYSPTRLSVFWRKFRTPLLLTIAYTLLCLISLFYNHSRYADLSEFLRWGVVFIIGQSFLPLCIFLFILSDDTEGVPVSRMLKIQVVTGLILALIPVSVLLQIYLPESAPDLMMYFVGGDLIGPYPIRGVLATSTDLGAISGVLCFVAIAFAVQTFQKSRLKSTLLIFCSIVFICVGLLSQSRNFILFLGVASVTISLASAWAKNRALVLAVLPAFAILFYLSAYVMPSGLVSRLGENIPHFENVSTGTATSIVQLFPNLSFDSLGVRGPLWNSAVRLIAENPLLGISNGGFRLADGCACFLANTHNIFLQSAIDAGVLGIVFMAALFAYIISKSTHDKWSLGFILGVIATLMVDNFTDHSYAWIVVTSFGGVVLAQRGASQLCNKTIESACQQ